MTEFAVKSSGKDHIEGLAIPFSRDMDKERFDASVTDFCYEWFPEEGRPQLYHHGFDPAMKMAPIGRQVEKDVREEGVWARVQLDMAAKYRKTIDELVEKGAVGFSSGAVSHLATKRLDGVWTSWPWVELSLTPIPAHPDTTVYAVKTADALDHLRSIDVDAPEPLIRAAFKALDEWVELRDAPPGSEALTARLDRVSGEVRGLVDHLGEHVEMKVKSGRSVSRATWQQVQSMAEVHRQGLALLEEFLADHDPDAAKALDAVLFESLATEARLLGVPV